MTAWEGQLDGWGRVSIAPWFAYLLPDPAASDSNHSSGGFFETFFDAAVLIENKLLIQGTVKSLIKVYKHIE